MNIFKPDFSPVNQQTYQRHIKLALVIHTACLLAFFLFSQFGNSEFSNYLIYSVTGVYFLLAIFIFHYIHPSRRFKDIYQGENLKNPILFMITAFPPLLIAFMCLLYFKDKSDRPAPKYLTHYGYFSLLFVPVIAICFVHPKVAYWVGGPATYYVVDTTYDAGELMKMNTFKAADDQTVYRHFVQTKSDKLSLTELLLITAISADQMKEKSKLATAAPKADKDAINQKFGSLIVHDLADALVRAENRKLDFTDYSIVQWASPSAALELFLITSVDEAIKTKLVEKMALVGNDVVVNLKKKVAKAPAGKKAGYEQVLKSAKSEFSKSKKYRSIASEK